MDDKLLGGLMNSFAACAVDETIRVALSLPTSLLRIDNSQVWFEEAPEYLKTTHRRLGGGAQLRLLRSIEL